MISDYLDNLCDCSILFDLNDFVVLYELMLMVLLFEVEGGGNYYCYCDD